MGERIKLGTQARIRAMGEMDTSRLLTLAREKAPDPSVFETFAPMFWQVRASSNRLDFYYTRMRAGRGKTLDNFVRGLKDGVSYQDSHNAYKNGWGQSLDGRLVTTDETDPETGDPIVEAWGDFFTLTGLNLSGQSTDDFAAAIRSGVWRDVSVGFYATDIECGLCGKQAMDWWSDDGCHHIPGVTYEIPTGDGNTREMVAWAWINDGELSEVSQVYDGASPGAGIAKAEQMSLEGQLDERSRSIVERRYQVRIAEPNRTYALGSVPLIDVRRGGDMPEKNDKTPAAGLNQDALTTAFARVAELNIDGFPGDSAPVEERVTALVSALESTLDESNDLAGEVEARGRTIAEHTAELERLRPLADAGKRYRDDLVADTLAAGVRALGKDFDEETYRGIFENASIDALKRFRDDYTRIGDEAFAGGRRSVEDADPEGKRPADSPRKSDPARYRA